MKSKFKGIIPIFIAGIIVLSYFIYNFPIQKNLAKSNFSKYIECQGIPQSNIQSMNVLKDYKQNGYCIQVVYKDDPTLKYEYQYYIGSNTYENTFNIDLIVYEDNKQIDTIGKEAKYPPL